jgi:hypothetical protein
VPCHARPSAMPCTAQCHAMHGPVPCHARPSAMPCTAQSGYCRALPRMRCPPRTPRRRTARRRLGCEYYADVVCRRSMPTIATGQEQRNPARQIREDGAQPPAGRQRRPPARRRPGRAVCGPRCGAAGAFAGRVCVLHSLAHATAGHTPRLRGLGGRQERGQAAPPVGRVMGLPHAAHADPKASHPIRLGWAIATWTCDCRVGVL